MENLAGLKRGLPVATSGAALERFKVTEESHERRIVLNGGDGTLGEVLIGTSPSFRQVYARTPEDDVVFSVAFETYGRDARRRLDGPSGPAHPGGGDRAHRPAHGDPGARGGQVRRRRSRRGRGGQRGSREQPGRQDRPAQLLHGRGQGRGGHGAPRRAKIGRASCRERVGQSVKKT